MQIIKITHKTHMLDISLIVWFGFAASYLIFKTNQETQFISAVLVLIGQAGLDLVAAISVYWLWRNTDDGFNQFYVSIFISFLVAFLADFSYNLLLNVKGVSLTPLIDSVFDIPFTLFLTFQAIAWFQLFNIIHQRNPYLRQQIISSAIGPLLFFSLFTFMLNWNTGYLSVIGLYHLCHNFLEAIGLFFVTLTLLKLRPVNLRMMCYGYLVILISDISIRHSIIIQHYLPLNPFEALWVLGLAFFIIGAVLAYTGSEAQRSLCFKMIDHLFRFIGIPLREKWSQHCICSKDIEKMIQYLLQSRHYEMEDLAQLLHVELHDNEDLTMLVATDQKSYETLWMIYQLTLNEKATSSITADVQR